MTQHYHGLDIKGEESQPITQVVLNRNVRILFMSSPFLHHPTLHPQAHPRTLAFISSILYRVFMGPRKHVLIFNAGLSRVGSVGLNLEAFASLGQEKQDKE